jgi:hypothetical protein
VLTSAKPLSITPTSPELTSPELTSALQLHFVGETRS